MITLAMCAMFDAGTFHLLHMLVDDYIMHTIESMREKEEEERHMDRINRLKRGTVMCTSTCVDAIIIRMIHTLHVMQCNFNVST